MEAAHILVVGRLPSLSKAIYFANAFELELYMSHELIGHDMITLIETENLSDAKSMC
jgi:hypothetical protein